MKPIVEANGLWNPFTRKKKWRISCGACEYTWDEKVPIKEPSTAICPHCKTLNKWSVVNFFKEYREAHYGGLY